MNRKVLILHGWGGSDFPHWQSWLAGEIAKDYGKVSFLKFSDFDFPSFDIWRNELKKELQEFKPDI
jgi:predicted alpha/beta hydrolase family esterase